MNFQCNRAAKGFLVSKNRGLNESGPGAIYTYGQDDILAALICIAVFFGQNHVYQVNYEGIDSSLAFLSENISPSVESFVRDITGLKHKYITKLEDILI